MKQYALNRKIKTVLKLSYFACKVFSCFFNNVDLWVMKETEIIVERKILFIYIYFGY